MVGAQCVFLNEWLCRWLEASAQENAQLLYFPSFPFWPLLCVYLKCIQFNGTEKEQSKENRLRESRLLSFEGLSFSHCV